MFQIGDKILYPMHGAGVIEAIEEKEILGKKGLYYIMNIRNMQVMFPKGAKLGIRQVVDSNILEDVLTIFNKEVTDQIQNPTARFRNNMNKMKSGDIYEGAQVIRDLVHLSKTKTLSSGDRNMLENARQILISELILVKDLDHEQANEFLNEVINY